MYDHCGEFGMINEPFRDDDNSGSFAALNNMTSLPFGNGAFGRQDSLSIASELQEKDKQRSHNTFMEADVNIENYLEELREQDEDDPIPDADPELQKMDFALAQAAYYENAHHGHRDDEFDDLLGLSHTHPKIKQEPISFEDEPSTSATRPARSTKGQVPDRFLSTEEEHDTTAPKFTPKTRARKYQLKPEEEKKSPHYKIKRQRNNDAVRRSRQKAKEAQEARDKELRDLHDKVDRLEKQNLKLQQALNQCRCRKI